MRSGSSGDVGRRSHLCSGLGWRVSPGPLRHDARVMQAKLSSPATYALSMLAVLAACATGGSPPPTPPAAADAAPLDPATARERALLDALDARTRATAQRYHAQLWAGGGEALHTHFSDAMRAALPLEKWRAVSAQITGGLGAETRLVSEGTHAIGGRGTYWRRAEMRGAPGVFHTTWVVDDAGVIHTFVLTQAEQAAPTTRLDYAPRTALVLPFARPTTGSWYVAWGGPDIEQNYHAKAKDQRFALDLLVVKDGKTFAGTGTSARDYFAFGQPVLATGPGLVAEWRDGIEDNAPGKMNPTHALGNFVILDHDNGEFSIFAHLEKGSVAVKAGQRVERGQPLGRCGNSGNTSEPHIHYHLQTSATPFEGEGLPPIFDAVHIDGVRRERVQLRGGQLVSPTR